MIELRTLLFVPADASRKVARAFDSNADCVILDLEDAVAPAAKLAARQAAVKALGSERARPAAVRINGQDTEWYRDDLLAIVAAKPDYVMLPKCRSIANLVRLDQELAMLEHAAGWEVGSISVLPLVTESADAVLTMDYRNAPRRTAALCFAAEDLASDLGIQPRDEVGNFKPPLAHARTTTVIAARAAGLLALDTPFPDPRRADLLFAEANAAADQGFAGKLCIHPDQLAATAQAFVPAPERLRWAEAVIAAFTDEPTAGVATVDGRMVDKAHLRLAEQLKARADA